MSRILVVTAVEGQGTDILGLSAMPPDRAILPLALFMLLLLAVTLCGLAASGHFPREHRSAALKSRTGSVILFGSLVLSALCLGSGIVLVWGTIPWSATVVGGGATMLLAPLALRTLPDFFVDGPSALIIFAGASMFIVFLIRITA